MSLFTMIFFCVLFSPISALAQDVQLQIPIGETKSITVCSGGLCHGIALYIVEFFKWSVGAITLLAVIAIMFGGIWWLTAAGSSEKVDQAKKIIRDSLGGLALALGSYLFLSLITPDLVNFSKGLKIENIDKIDFDSPDPGPMIRDASSASSAGLRAYHHANIYGVHGKLLEGTATALEKAAEICAKKSQKITIRDPWRSFEDQTRLYALYKTGKGNPACNPGNNPSRVLCPHTSGLAVDLDTSGLSDDQYAVLSTCMKDAGWCRLTGGKPCEPWHFEYPPLSRSCNPTFTPSWRSPSRTACGSPH